MLQTDKHAAREKAYGKVEEAVRKVAAAKIPKGIDVTCSEEFRQLAPAQRRVVLDLMTAIVGVAMLEQEAARQERGAPAWAAGQLAERCN